jgi:hypothetical protein
VGSAHHPIITADLIFELFGIIEFNQTDWEASVQYIQNHLDDINPKIVRTFFYKNFFSSLLFKGISWKAVRYMISEIQYGGRITDDRDRRLMITYAKVYFIFINLYKILLIDMVF